MRETIIRTLIELGQDAVAADSFSVEYGGVSDLEASILRRGADGIREYVNGNQTYNLLIFIHVPGEAEVRRPQNLRKVA